MAGRSDRDEDPEMADIAGLRAGTSGGRAGLGWVVALLILLGLGLALWAYLR